MTEILFRAIKTFVNDLADIYSYDIHALALYDRLLQKTTIQHVEAVDKHISAFRKFFDVNKTAILEDSTKFEGIIEYSKKVFIDMNDVYRVVASDIAKIEVRKAIRMHLLTISALLDPASGAKDMLVSLNGVVDTGKPIRFEGESNEENFLNGIMDSVTKTVQSGGGLDEIKSPQDAMTKMLGSGVINEIVSNISSNMATGNLDIGKMFGAVQNMVGNLTKNSQDDPQLTQMLGMMNMMGSTFAEKK